jgi:hypothetical protein
MERSESALSGNGSSLCGGTLGAHPLHETSTCSPREFLLSLRWMAASVRQMAWEPFTPRGVAAFAAASLGRVLLVQLVVGLWAAGTATWCVGHTWWPTISAAIMQLPEQGQIRGGHLTWRKESPTVLAEARCLALTVDLLHGGKVRSPAHVQIEFGEHDVEVFSLFGYFQWRYPPGYVIAFARPDLQPWWGAWAPALLALLFLMTLTGLLFSWGVLATVFSGPVWLIGFFANRQLTWRGSWRLAGAGLVPGALFLSGAIVLYGLGALDPVGLLVAWVLHLVIGCLYLAISPFFLLRSPDAENHKTNPFQEPQTK